MFEKAKMPLIKGFSAALFTFLILSYQNCAKPLNDIGMSSPASTSTSGTPSCSLTLSSANVAINSPLTVGYSYTPATDSIRIVVTTSNGANVSSTLYNGNGSTTLTNPTAGTYIVSGVVQNSSGVAEATCQQTYTVSTVYVPPEPPAPSVPTITLSGDKTSCTGSCTLNLTHNSATIGSSGHVFRIVKLNGSTTEDVVCKSVSGTATTPVSLTYAADPGLNSFVAYFVSTCSSPITNVQASATFNMTMNNSVTPPPPPPPSVTPTITLSTNLSVCTGSCTVSLTQNASNISNSGKVFSVYKIKSDGTTTNVSCISINGSTVSSLFFGYAASPGINTLNAYLVPTCTSSITGVTPSASTDVEVEPRIGSGGGGGTCGTDALCP
jgi:hypothetical protein